MTSEPGSAAMERTEREKLAYRIQGIMSLTLSVEDGEIMGTGQASFQASDMLLATIETLTRERDEAREALKEAKAVVDVAETMTSCGSDDDWIWGVQAKIKAALAGGKQE